MFLHDFSRAPNEPATASIAVAGYSRSLILGSAQWLARLARRFGAAIRGETLGQRTLRWCDSTERTLVDDLTGLRRTSFTVD